MKTYKFPQHQIENEQASAIQCAVNNWAIMSHEERTAFIDSINVYTNPAWLEVRAGKFTASTASQFLTDSRTKGETLGDSCKTLCHKVMAEQSGWREARNPYMEYASIRRGLCFESVARKLAEQKLGKEITEVGFVEADTMFGCSPDGLIMDGENIEALVEIKCPEPIAFYEQLMNAAKREYQLQMQFSMNICNCPRAYFVLYCPEVSPDVYILKYTRGIYWQNKIETRKQQVADYIHKVNQQVASGDIEVATIEQKD